jgi:NAD(P)-dependent dehydrogenase (short-subunit alcohol dehydrogenase family)
MAVRTPVGLDAAGAPFVKWFLPDSFYDFILKKTFARLQGDVPLRPAAHPAAPVALITGANSGIGLACAEALASGGTKVYAGYRDPKRAVELKALSRKLPIAPIRLDVNSSSSVQRAAAWIGKKEGKIDVLLNNAGFVMAGFWEDLSDQDIRGQFETNVFGVLRVTRAVLPMMRKRGAGKILNIGSVAGFVSIPGLGAYSASKYALTCLTEALRVESAPWGIQVGEIAPGEIQSSIVQNTRMGEKVLSPKSPYYSFTQSFKKFEEKRFGKAAPVQKVVKSVLRALGDNSLKRRYLVKAEDRLLYKMKWFLPDALWEWGMGLQFPWSRFPKR